MKRYDYHVAVKFKIGAKTYLNISCIKYAKSLVNLTVNLIEMGQTPVTAETAPDG